MLTTTEVDKTGASYYGEQGLHYLSAKGEGNIVILGTYACVFAHIWHLIGQMSCDLCNWGVARHGIWLVRCHVTCNWGVVMWPAIGEVEGRGAQLAGVDPWPDPSKELPPTNGETGNPSNIWLVRCHVTCNWEVARIGCILWVMWQYCHSQYVSCYIHALRMYVHVHVQENWDIFSSVFVMHIPLPPVLQARRVLCMRWNGVRIRTSSVSCMAVSNVLV